MSNAVGSSAQVGSTVETAEIANDSVTYAKIQNVAANKVLGSIAGGDPEEIDCTAAGRVLIDDANAAAQLATLGAAPLASPTFTGTPTIPSTTANFNVGNTLGVVNGIYCGAVAGGSSPIIGVSGINSVLKIISGADAVSPCWISNVGGMRRVSADVTNATVTPANITDLTENVLAGRHYTGRYVFKCSDSQAAEGIRFDFDGGACTMTAFAAGARIITSGTVVVSVEVSSALATDFVWTTITGETWILIELGFTVNAGGTFIPRFAQSTHTSGTATLSRGSFGHLNDSP